MNTFTLSKLGEVLAFARVGKDTAAKGKKALLELLKDSDLSDMDTKFDDIIQSVESFAKKEEGLEEVKKQAKETQSKVTDMRDTYIGDNWDEDSEVLEWMGFYTGASLVHWYLLSGAAEAADDTELGSISHDAIAFYTSLITSDEDKLKQIGADKNKE